MASYVVISGQPVAMGTTDLPLAIVLVDDGEWAAIGGDRNLVDAITEGSPVPDGIDKPTDDLGLLAWLTRHCTYYRTGPVVQYDDTLADAADILERIYFPDVNR